MVTRPDLVTTLVNQSSLLAVPGGSFVATDTAMNQSGLGAPATTTRYYLSFDTLRDTGDRLLTGTRVVPTLNPGETSTGSVTVTIPNATTLGTYFLLACADDLAPKVTEINETNNCFASTATVQVTRPDVVETAITDPPAVARRRGSFGVTDSVMNQGGWAAPATTTRYYLSIDTVSNAGDKRLSGTRSILTLNTGETSTGTVSVTIPNNTAFGTYFLLACADDAAPRVTEIDETNNCRASAGTVVVGP